MIVRIPKERLTRIQIGYRKNHVIFMFSSKKENDTVSLSVTTSVQMADLRKKEIYTYDAPWPVYGMAWSTKPEHKFRLALGSFIEEYSNKVNRLFSLDCIQGRNHSVK